MDVDPKAFEQLVADALDSIPEELGTVMQNVAVFVEDWPTQEQLAGRSGTEEQLVDMVTETVIHEVAHHFGISDARLRELGW